MSRLISLQEKELPAQIQASSVPSHIEPGAMGNNDSAGAVQSRQIPTKSPADSLEKVEQDLSKPHQVELYITSWCPYCKKAVNFFQSRGIPYTAYDIEKDDNAARRKNQLDSRRGAPFAIIDGQKIHGFSDGAYLKALKFTGQ